MDVSISTFSGLIVALDRGCLTGAGFIEAIDSRLMTRSAGEDHFEDEVGASDGSRSNSSVAGFHSSLGAAGNPRGHF